MDSDAGSYGYPPDVGGGGPHAGLIVLLLLVLLAIASASGWGGHWYARSSHDTRREAARKAIYKTIRTALNKALHARGAEQVIAATLLAKVVTERLRPFVLTGRPIFGAVGAIDKALSGKTLDTGGHGHGDGGHGDGGHGDGHGGDHGSGAAAVKTERTSASTLVVTPNVITNIHVGGEPEKKPEPEKKKDEHGDKPKERPMTIPEQYAAVGKAVEDFDKAWQERDVLAFLKEAQEALLDFTPPPEPNDHH